MVQLAEKVSEIVAAEYLERLAAVLRSVPNEPIARTVDLLLATREQRRRVYIMGNGGSAATASHFVCDLIKTAKVAGHAPLRVFALADNSAVLTAWANDTAYEHTFSEQINALVEHGDVVIAISASGNSPNILAGLRAATEAGAHTVALVGFDGGRASHLSDITVHVPSHDYGLVEDTHSAIGHAITAAVRGTLEAQSQ
jgi:D-sedoheptulose 7-phosphate isomerase